MIKVSGIETVLPYSGKMVILLLYTPGAVSASILKVIQNLWVLPWFTLTRLPDSISSGRFTYCPSGRPKVFWTDFIWAILILSLPIWLLPEVKSSIDISTFPRSQSGYNAKVRGKNSFFTALIERLVISSFFVGLSPGKTYSNAERVNRTKPAALSLSEGCRRSVSTGRLISLYV